jgi:hypothetical protein
MVQHVFPTARDTEIALLGLQAFQVVAIPPRCNRRPHIGLVFWLALQYHLSNWVLLCGVRTHST